jgi:hypothetical protein
VEAPSLEKLSTEGRNKFAVRRISGAGESLRFAQTRRRQPISALIQALDYSEDNISSPKTLLKIAKKRKENIAPATDGQQVCKEILDN